MFNRPTKVMADNELVGLLGINAMHDIVFAENIKTATESSVTVLRK